MDFETDAEKRREIIRSDLYEESINNSIISIIDDHVNRNIFGKTSDSMNIDHLSWLSAGLSSSMYAIKKMARSARLADAIELLTYALHHAPAEGMILEFGVYAGRTINHIASLRPAAEIYGFDSFEGLPEDWRPGFDKGVFSLAEPPHVPVNVSLIKGWFDRTLPPFYSANQGKRVALIHMDCDIYQSTQTVFANIKQLVAPGTIIVFDEYFNYPGWEKHEYKAFQEYCASDNISYEYIGIVPSHQQVAVRILG